MFEKNCPSQNELRSFLNGDSSAHARGEMEIHLAGCPNCRRQISANYVENKQSSDQFDSPQDLINTAKDIAQKESDGEAADPLKITPTVAGWRGSKGFRIAAAMCVLIFTGIFGVYLSQRDQVSMADDPFRNSSSRNRGIDLLFPENEKIVVSEAVKFEWNGSDGVKNYSLIFSDEKGDIVGKFETGKTSLERSLSEFGLADGRIYFWHVTAKLPDGSQLKSEFRKIVFRK